MDPANISGRRVVFVFLEFLLATKEWYEEDCPDTSFFEPTGILWRLVAPSAEKLDF